MRAAAGCVALLVLSACSGDDDGGDGGGPDASADAERDDARGDDAGAPDAGDVDAGDEDAGPPAHPCDALGSDLDAIVAAAADYESVTRDPGVQYVAARIVRLAHTRRVSELSVAALDGVLADPSDPVHSASNGTAYVTSVVARERTRIAAIDAELTTLLARASEPGYETIDDPGGPERILDAITWRDIGARARDLQARCAGDRSAVGDDEVGTFVSDVGVMQVDADHGHSTVRGSTVARLLGGGGVP